MSLFDSFVPWTILYEDDEQCESFALAVTAASADAAIVSARVSGELPECGHVIATIKGDVVNDIQWGEHPGYDYTREGTDALVRDSPPETT
jgi:hypothetical protein